MFGFQLKELPLLVSGVICLFFHIKELPLLVLSGLCLFFHIKELPLFSNIHKNNGKPPMYEYVTLYIMYYPVLPYYTEGTTITYWWYYRM